MLDVKTGTDPTEILKKELEKEKIARKKVEKALKSKSMELDDITRKLKDANADLEVLFREKANELKAVFENIIDAFLVMDLYGNVLKMNEAAIKLFGYNNKEESINLKDVLYQDDYKYTIKAFQELINTGSFSNYKPRIIAKDTSIKFLAVNASLIYNDEGKPIAAQGIARDITEEVKNKELIEEQQKELSVIVDNSPLGIALTSKDGLIKCNNAFQKLLGYTGKELKEFKVQGYTHEEDREISIKMLKKLYKGELDSYNLKKRYIKKNGEALWVSLYVGAVRDASGKVKYEVAIIEDISEQLEKQLENKKLLKNLESSNYELQEYAHVVSHDLKSPLRSISALTSWLKDDYESVLDDDGMNNINLIQETVEKMDRLINDILNYSSINKGITTVEDVNVYEVINHIKGLIFVPKHIEVIIDKKLPIIKADKTRIQQLFQNLISNAVNYIDKEKGEVIVNHVEEKDAWIFSIKDNGIGISKIYHEKIFNVFQSMSNHKESTGIGLSIVKKIVEMYEGEIWLESEENIGTTFYIKLKK